MNRLKFFDASCNRSGTLDSPWSYSAAEFLVEMDYYKIDVTLLCHATTGIFFTDVSSVKLVTEWLWLPARGWYIPSSKCREIQPFSSFIFAISRSLIILIPKIYYIPAKRRDKVLFMTLSDGLGHIGWGSV